MTNDYAEAKKDFIGYEYRDISVSRDKEGVYVDAYEQFGWKLEDNSRPFIGVGTVNLRFKRDRKIRNKAELTRLQRQFDSCISEIERMESSKTNNAMIVALAIGLIGTACMAGATFAFLGSLIVLCIVLAVPGFIGWALPYFMYKSVYAKRVAKITPLIDAKYDEIYEVCEKASGLLGN